MKTARPPLVAAMQILALALVLPAPRSTGATVNFQVTFAGSIGPASYTNNWGFAQGVAMNGGAIYHFSTQSISKQSVSNLTAFSGASYNNSPFAGLTNAYNHLGAGCFYGSNLYVSAEVYDGCGKVTNASIEVFDATTLAYKSITMVTNYQGEISAVTISPGGIMYTTDFCDGSHIFMYDTNLNYLGAIPLSANIPLIQGIACYNNLLLVIADYGGSGNLWAVDPASGNCSLLTTLTVPGNNEWEGIAVYNGTLLACEAGTGGLYYYPINTTQLNFRLNFAQVPGAGQLFQVQYKTKPMATNWINLGAPLAAGSNGLSITDFSGDSQRCYRAQLMP